MSDAETSLGLLDTCKDDCLEFLDYSAITNDEVNAAASHIKTVYDAACLIYRLRGQKALSSEHSRILTRQIRRGLEEHTKSGGAGSHALVWVCFVAAAESTSQGDRDYFTDRLRAIFSHTRFRTIPAGILLLQKIWESDMDMEGDWIKLVCSNPVLVM